MCSIWLAEFLLWRPNVNVCVGMKSSVVPISCFIEIVWLTGVFLEDGDSVSGRETWDGNFQDNVSSLRGESENRLVKSNSLQPHGLYSPWNFPDQNTGVGSLSLPQGVFPTQGSNPGLLHCKVLYQLSYQGSLSERWVWYKVEVYRRLSSGFSQTTSDSFITFKKTNLHLPSADTPSPSQSSNMMLTCISRVRQRWGMGAPVA